jgi:putative hemolysin
VDDPSSSTYLFAFICLVLSGAFSASEAAILSSDEARLKSRYSSDPRLRSILAVNKSPAPVMSSILLGNTLVNAMFSALAAFIIHSIVPGDAGLADAIATAAATVMLLVFAEVSPKLVSGGNPEAVALWASSWLLGLARALAPVSSVLTALSGHLVACLPQPDTAEEDFGELRFLAAVEYGEEAGAISGLEKEMIWGAMETHDLLAKDIMTPRPRIVAASEDQSTAEALDLMLKYGFSRIPVYADSIDNVTGILNMKDIALLISCSPNDWRERLDLMPCVQLAVRPYFTHERKRVSDLLIEMRLKGIHTAIVVDGHDGVSGLVTLEDALEVIVGDIQDEYDEETPELVMSEAGCCHVVGSVRLADLAEAFDVELPTEEFDSVADFIMACLDRVPSEGDAYSLVGPRLTLEVVEMDGPRIKRAIVRLSEMETGRHG